MGFRFLLVAHLLLFNRKAWIWVCFSTCFIHVAIWNLPSREPTDIPLPLNIKHLFKVAFSGTTLVFETEYLMIPVIPSQFRLCFFHVSAEASNFVRSKSLPVPWTIPVALGLGVSDGLQACTRKSRPHATPEPWAVGPAYMCSFLDLQETFGCWFV